MNRKFIYFLYLFCFFIISPIWTQNTHNYFECGTQKNRQKLLEKYPDWDDQFEKWLAPRVKQVKQQMSTNRGSRSAVTIPVIVHIIHNAGETPGTGYNIDYSYIVSQIQEANLNLRALMADTINIPTAFKPFEADCEIELCLALIDTNNNILPEIGVNRVDINTVPGQDDSKHNAGYGLTDFDSIVKTYTIWDPDRYFNVWVANLSGGVLGYAQFPEGSGLPGFGLPGLATGPTSDGVVMHYEYMGAPSLSTNTDLNNGRIFAHEVGHWLGLRHIWGDANCGDDFCADTPPQENNNQGTCPSFPHKANNTCSPSSGPDGEMYGNYMGYVNAACMNIFSQDQKARMQTVLANSPRRGILTSSNVCQSPFPYNAAVTQIILPPDSSCTNDIDGQIKLTNQGTNTLTSVDIYYSIDGGPQSLLTWTGTLASGASTTINLATITTISGNHTYEVFIDTLTLNGSNTDGWTTNNTLVKPFYSVNGNGILFNLTTDCKADDITWEIVEVPSGNVMLSGGGYDPGVRNIQDEDCLDSGCYILRIMDFSGNGLKKTGLCSSDGTYTLIDQNSGLNIAIQGSNPNWGDTVEHDFCLPYDPDITPDFNGCDTVYPGIPVSFTDISISVPPAIGWKWHFGDGSPFDFTQNPTHTYASTGNYDIKLVVTNPGISDSITKAGCVVVIPTPLGYCDTLRNYSDSDTMVTYTPISGWGHFPGHNNTSITGYAEPYNLPGPTNTIQKVLIPVFQAHNGDPNSYFALNVYDDNAGEPGNVLSSDTILISSLAPNSTNEVKIGSPPLVTGDFWVGFEIDYSNNDTLGIGTALSFPGRDSTTYVKAGGIWLSSKSLTNLNSSIGFKVVFTDFPAFGNYTVSSNQICEGQTVTFDASASTNYDSLTWYFPGGNPSTSTNANVTVTYPTAGTYDAILFLEAICSADSNRTTIVVDDAAPTVSFSESATTICEQDTIFFDGTATIGSNLNLNWSFNGGNPTNSSQTADTVIYNFPGIYSTKLVAENGCGIDSLEKTITVNDFPTTTVSPHDTTVCDGESVTLSANGGTAYSWSDLSTTQTITVSPTTNTTYWVTSSDGSCLGDTAYATINVNPIPLVIPNANPDTVCLGGLISFSINGSNAIYYSWDFGDGNISNIPNTTHIYTAIGTYSVNLTGVYGLCDNDSTMQVAVISCAGISEHEWNNGIKIYPNPTQNNLTITTDFNTQSNIDVQIISATGKLMYQNQLNNVTQSIVSIDVTSFAKGVYLINFHNNKFNSSKKLIIVD